MTNVIFLLLNILNLLLMVLPPYTYAKGFLAGMSIILIVNFIQYIIEENNDLA